VVNKKYFIVNRQAITGSSSQEAYQKQTTVMSAVKPF